MGSCCCCLRGCSSSATKRTSKTNELEKAQLATHTKGGHKINPFVNKQFITEERIKMMAMYSHLDYKVVLAKPYRHFSQITYHLYLTGIGGITRENMITYNIKHIVNVSYELNTYDVSGVESIRIPVVDDNKEDISIYFDEIADRINKWKKTKDNVVVHCMCGVSRSVTIVLAYLIKYHKMSLKDSFKYVKDRRPVIEPNIGFIKQLINFEQKCLKKTSVVMVPMGEEKIPIPDIYGELYAQQGKVVTSESIKTPEQTLETSSLDSSMDSFNRFSF